MTQPQPTAPAPRPFSDRSIRLAGRILRLVLKEPDERERIDALAAACNAMFALPRERPDIYKRLTRSTWDGRRP